MDMLGIHWVYLVIQILVCGIYPGLAVWALLSLRRSQGTNVSKVLWVMLILAVPILGSLAFFVMGKTPAREKPTKKSS
jgi:hypothetical protein